ncbi:MAG: AraC family transcriptional regulator [Clostridiales bacterium]|nr:AraC family transcriptional regulator [Clostridiales bacterium]
MKKELHYDISVCDVIPTHPIWNKMLSIGSAEDLLRSEIQDHIVLLKAAFDFEYVRFWSPFTKELLIDVNDPKHDYNFSKLDYIFDFLLQQGLKSHIELIPKPKRIQKNSDEAIIYKENAPFHSIDDWEFLIDAFMKHIIYRYSKAVISEWRMEIWKKESEIEGVDNSRQYFDTFSTTYRIIKKYCENIQVGGCGLQTYLHSEYPDDFMRKFYRNWDDEAIKPDFISIMSYPYEYNSKLTPINPVSKRSTNFSHTKQGVENILDILSPLEIGQLPICVAEWNLTISDRNFINDSCFKGAYIIKTYIELYGCVDEMAYFIGSDHTSEFYDTNVPLYGGTGLITRDGILKPAGFALDFLNRSYPYFIEKGDNYFITTDNFDSYGIVCHNCKELNYNYYNTDENKIEKENISKYFEDNDPLDLHFHFKNITDGTYQIKIYKINGSHGSVLKLWEEMDYEQDISSQDIRYLRRVCEPNLTIKKCIAKHNCIDLDLNMSANEIAFINLSRRE